MERANTALIDPDNPVARVPELSEYLAKLDTAYASLPSRPKAPEQLGRAPHPDNTLSDDLRGAALLLVILVTCSVGTLMAVGAFLLGFGWLTILATYAALPTLALAVWAARA